MPGNWPGPSKNKNKNTKKQKKQRRKENIFKNRLKNINLQPPRRFFLSPAFPETRLFLCFHSHYIENKSFIQDILISLLPSVNGFTQKRPAVR